MRRSPLRRSATLRGGRAGTGPSQETVELILERASYLCEVGGCEIGDRRGWDWSVQHRAPRQMGGTLLTTYSLPGNLLIACGSGTTGCHGVIESHRTAAYEAGWLIRRRRGVVPSQVPVLVVIAGQRMRVLLTDDGQYAPVPGVEL